MPRIGCIVEGHGDALSIPIILRRIAASRGVFDLTISGPFRHHRHAIVRAGELERAVERAARSLSGPGGILIVLDADDDAACRLGPELNDRARVVRPDVPTRVVLAVREKEAWYLASLESLRGRRGIPEDATPHHAPEDVRGAKEGLSALMGRPYSEVTDQAALAALFDLELARRGAPSFERFVRLGRALP